MRAPIRLSALAVATFFVLGALPTSAQDDDELDEAQPGDDALEGEWIEGDDETPPLEGEWETGPDEGTVPEDPAAQPPADSHADSPPDPTAEPADPEGEPPVDEPSTDAAPAPPAGPAETTTGADKEPGIELENVPSGVEVTEIGEEEGGVAGSVDAQATRRVGEPYALTRREPLLGQWGFEVGVHYGLVGTGPTRLTNDFRFGLFDWWELRATLAPYPAGLMSRFKIGSQQGLFGALIVDGGLANFDAGVRLVEDTGESAVGPRFHLEGGLAYARAVGPWLSIYGSARLRYRWSPVLPGDDQNVVAVDAHVTYDLLSNLAITAGLGYSEVIGTPVRELTVNIVEVDRPGMSHFLLRDDGWSRAVTVPLAITYGRVDSFDVDLFITPRVYPQFDIMFGAGIRWRIAEVFSSKRVFGVDTDYLSTSVP